MHAPETRPVLGTLPTERVAPRPSAPPLPQEPGPAILALTAVVAVLVLVLVAFPDVRGRVWAYAVAPWDAPPQRPTLRALIADPRRMDAYFADLCGWSRRAVYRNDAPELRAYRDTVCAKAAARASAAARARAAPPR